MSSDMVSWAFRQYIPSASRKIVLVALADFAGQDGTTWGSIDVLCAKTSLNRKTVISAIGELEERGYLVDTGDRRGSTNLIKIYNFVTDGHESTTLDKQYRKRNSTENGTVPKTDGNSTVFSVKQSQKRTETVPKTGLESLGDSKELLIEKREEENAIATGKDLGFQPNAFSDEELVSEPLPRTTPPRSPQPFLTTSQTQEQSKCRAKVFGWIYSAIHGQELQGAPSPGALKKYAEALDWFISSSITAEQICRAVAAAKAQWHNLDNVKQAINPRSLADNWHTLYTPPKATAAAPRTAAPQFDLSKPLLGLSRKSFIDLFAHRTQIQRWEVFEAWAKERPDMLDHAIYARELATAVEKAITFGKDRYTVEPDPKGLELEF